MGPSGKRFPLGPLTFSGGVVDWCMIKIDKLSSPEHYGDWHDKPLRWAVNGPDKECQKFSTKRDAEKYASIRRRSANQTAAHAAFCA